MIEIPDTFLDTIVDRLAPRLAERLAGEMPDTAKPTWMKFKGLLEYTQLPEGTLRKLVADGRIPKHGGKTHIFYRDEVDEALLGYARRRQLRKAS
jgi:hypothetical protein